MHSLVSVVWVFLLCLVFAVESVRSPTPTLGVVVDKHSHSGFRTVVLPFDDEPLLAWGSFKDSIASDGWSYLSVHSNASQSNVLQARAAGFVEGALTAQRIWEFASNHMDQFSWSPKLRDYVCDNNKWMAEQIAAKTKSGKLEERLWWSQVKLILEQQRGLFEGYTAHAAPGQELTEEVILTLSMHSDMDTLCPLLGGCGPVNSSFSERGTPPPSAPNRMKDHCSVIVKLVPEKNELYTAHTTWTGYEDMTRVYKLYELPYSITREKTVAGTNTVPGTSIAFSSYPGNVFSTDDWYTISSGLAVTETTIDNHNTTLWQHVAPNTVLTWIRTMVANRLAFDGPSWANAFKEHNSGTYNNEFHVVDYNAFAKYKNGRGESALPRHLLTVVDQMPGHVEIADKTSVLKEKGYWASYNRPGLEATYKLANYSATVNAYGPHYSHKLSSRAQLFDLLQDSIVDEANLKKVMRFNRFNDPAIPPSITHQMCRNGPSASNAISERGDLTSVSSECGEDVAQQNEGGIDLKYTTATMMEAANGLAAVAQSGPTYDNQPVFTWSTSPFAHVPHVGQPDRWEFPYVTIDWSEHAE